MAKQIERHFVIQLNQNESPGIAIHFTTARYNDVLEDMVGIVADKPENRDQSQLLHRRIGARRISLFCRAHAKGTGCYASERAWIRYVA